jgi:uncharacterized protein (DUF433 family)
MQDLKQLIVSNPNIHGGEPLFHGTRAPVRILFQHLEKGISLEEFLDDFPTVSREQAVALLSFLENMITAENLEKLNEIAA